MRLFINIFVLFILAFYSRALPQSSIDTTSGVFPLTIYTIECRLIERNSALDYRIHYSPDIILHDRFDFEVRLRLKSEDNYSIPDSTIGVIIQTWNGEEEKYVLNPKNYILKNNNYYDFLFGFASSERSFATCNLVWYNKTNNTFGPVNYSKTTLSRNFLLH